MSLLLNWFKFAFLSDSFSVDRLPFESLFESPPPNVFQLVISYLLRKNFWQQLSTKKTPQFNINCTKAVSIDKLYVSVFVIDFEQLFSLLRGVLKKKQPLQMFLSSTCNIMKEKHYPGILIDFLILFHRWESG